MQGPDLRVADYFHAADFGYKLRLLPAIEQLGAAGVLRLSLTKRRASALKASSYLYRLSGDAPLVLIAITEEIYVLLLSAYPRPHQDYLSVTTF
jgi:hypothetical protein